MREDVKVFLYKNRDDMPFSIESLGVSYCDDTYRMTRFDSHVNVFEYVISGKGTVITSAGTFHPSAGDSYFLREHEFHDYYSDPEDPWVKIWINVLGDLPSNVLDAYGLHTSAIFPKLDISDYLEQIHRIAYAEVTDLDTMYDRCFVVFVKLCQFLRQTLSAHDKYSDIPENIAELKKYIDSHLDEVLTLEMCNEITHLSTSQTIRSFRQAYGMPPYEYLNQQRIETAKVMLRGSLLSVQEIALQLGFTDQYYFSKYFKKRVGKSPKDYRHYK